MWRTKQSLHREAEKGTKRKTPASEVGEHEQSATTEVDGRGQWACAEPEFEQQRQRMTWSERQDEKTLRRNENPEDIEREHAKQSVAEGLKKGAEDHEGR